MTRREDARTVRSLRERKSLTEAETDALRVLRQREINECIRLRRSAAPREP
jgi:hypothetical protein